MNDMQSKIQRVMREAVEKRGLEFLVAGDMVYVQQPPGWATLMLIHWKFGPDVAEVAIGPGIAGVVSVRAAHAMSPRGREKKDIWARKVGYDSLDGLDGLFAEVERRLEPFTKLKFSDHPADPAEYLPQT